MQRAAWIGALAICVTATPLTARDFPLNFKLLDADQAFALPGISGGFGSLSNRKPASLKKEPAATSKRPLYGEMRNFGAAGFAFRVDESAASKGYDLLIIDLNQNGDLTDDAVTRALAECKTVNSRRYGPITGSTKEIGGRNPVYFAEVHHYRGPLSSSSGQLRLRPGFLLETTVEVEGVTQKIAVCDGNANFILGDESKPSMYRSGTQENWFFVPADNYLCDLNGNGKFDSDALGSEARPFGLLQYIGKVPCRVSLAANARSLSVERWPEALAEVIIEPRGEQVRHVVLAHERKAGDWRLIRAEVTNGRTRVPPGKIRLTGCVVQADNQGQPIAVSGTYRKLDTTIDARPAQPAKLQCGGPLEMRVSTERQKSTALIAGRRATASESEWVLRIKAEVVGGAGESYSVFARGADLQRDPAMKPKFTIVDKRGKEIAAGTMEFG